jgi:hypothetical protein
MSCYSYHAPRGCRRGARAPPRREALRAGGTAYALPRYAVVLPNLGPYRFPGIPAHTYIIQLGLAGSKQQAARAAAARRAQQRQQQGIGNQNLKIGAAAAAAAGRLPTKKHMGSSWNGIAGT